MAELDSTADGALPASTPALATVTSSTDEAGILVLSLTGEVDIATAPGARAEIDQILEGRTPGPVAFDLSGLRFMDSSGLALLLTIAGQTEQVERIEIRNPSRIVRRVIEISGLADALPMTP